MPGRHHRLEATSELADLHDISELTACTRVIGYPLYEDDGVVGILDRGNNEPSRTI